MMTPLYDWLGKRSFAQSGEDIIADIELEKKSHGIYVDVGAYHPKLFSNTYLFYKKRWRGICVDPNPEMQKLFELARPRDVFLNVGVGEVGGGRLSQLEYEIRNDDIERNVHRSSMTYFMFDEATANTFSEEQAGKNQEVGRKLLGTKKIEILSLKEILDSNLKKGERIDLLSVDVEGMDLEVLESSDWKKYRPKVVICEDLGFDLDSFCAGRDDTKLRRQSLKVVEGKGVVGYLQGLGYKLKAMTPYSMIFRDEK